MSYVYARVSLRGKQSKYRKVLQADKNIYEPFISLVQESVVYSTETVLEEGMWYCISSFSKSEFSIDLAKDEFDSVDFDVLNRDEFCKLSYIFSKSADNNEIYFQKIGKSSLISKKHILCIDGDYKYKEDCSSIVIRDCPDAIYIKDKDMLYFRNLSAITSIFPGISTLYREATELETRDFLNMDFLTTDGLTVENVKTPNRKRIALAMETLNNMKKKEKKEIYEYIADYCPELRVVNKQFVVSEDSELTLVLYGIEQRFYTTVIGKEKRIANSVIKL